MANIFPFTENLPRFSFQTKHRRFCYNFYSNFNSKTETQQNDQRMDLLSFVMHTIRK